MKVLSLPSHLKKVHKHWSKLRVVEEFYSQKNWLESISAANELIETMETDFFGYYYRGLVNMELKLFEEAIADFEISLVNLETNRFPSLMQDYKRDANYRITWVFRLQRRYSEALERINSTLENFPKYVGAYKLKAAIYEDLGELENSLASIKTGLNYVPRNTELLEYKNYFGQRILAEKEE